MPGFFSDVKLPISRIDPRTNRVVARISNVGAEPSSIATGFGSVWVTDREAGTLARIDPRRNRVAQKARVGQYPEGVAAAAGSIWVASRGADTVSRVDPDSLQVLCKIPVRRIPYGIYAGLGSLWVLYDFAFDGNDRNVLTRIPLRPAPCAP